MSAEGSYLSGSSEVESSESHPGEGESASSSASSSSSDESASDPGSWSSSEGGASSALSVDSSDNSGSVVPADSSLLLALSPDGASLGTSVESSDNSRSLPESTPDASGEGVSTSSPGCALLSLSDESSDDLGSSEEPSASSSESPSSNASDPLSTWGSHDRALSALVGESLHNNGLGAPADSLVDSALSPDDAFVGTLFESSDDSGTSHVSEPGASGPPRSTSLVSDTSLTLSVPSSDDLT